MYKPENLTKWTRPDSWFGKPWPDYYYSGVGQSRDSDCLERSNFAAMLTALGGESETVTVVREGHWAVGWIEWIAIHESDDKALETADEIVAALSDYPIIDESALSDMEWNEAAEAWERMSPRERVQEAIWQRSRCHWLANVPAWPIGRMDWFTLANSDHPLANYVYESVRDNACNN